LSANAGAKSFLIFTDPSCPPANSLSCSLKADTRRRLDAAAVLSASEPVSPSLAEAASTAVRAFLAGGSGGGASHGGVSRGGVSHGGASHDMLKIRKDAVQEDSAILTGLERSPGSLNEPRGSLETRAIRGPGAWRRRALGARSLVCPSPVRALSTGWKGTERLAWLYRPLPATPPARKHFWGVRIEPRGALWAGYKSSTRSLPNAL